MPSPVRIKGKINIYHYFGSIDVAIVLVMGSFMDLPSLTEVHSVFGEPVRNVAPASKISSQGRKFIEVRQWPLNFTTQDLSIAYRNGLSINLPRQYSRDSEALIIRTEIRLEGLVEINVKHLLSVAEEHCSSEMKLIRQAISLRDQHNPDMEPFGGLILVIDYSISLAELRKFGGSVYFHEADLLVSHLPVDRAPQHPYSEQGTLSTLRYEQHRNGHERFGFVIEIIDNQGKIGERYINIGRRVSKIPPKLDPRRLDGIYVSWTQAVSGRLSLPEEQIQCFSPEEADTEFNLFKTYAEAETYGDGDLARKKELVTLEHATVVEKAQLQHEKTRSDQDTLKLETNLKELVHEHEVLKQDRDRAHQRLDLMRETERQQMKDYYENRSVQRKDGSELLRIIPAIVMGIGAVILAVKALF